MGAEFAQPQAALQGGQCQPGFYCPRGSAEQLECSLGMYCADPELSEPNGNCSAGFYCVLGADTSTPTDGTTGRFHVFHKSMNTWYVYVFEISRKWIHTMKVPGTCLMQLLLFGRFRSGMHDGTLLWSWKFQWYRVPTRNISQQYRRTLCGWLSFLCSRDVLCRLWKLTTHWRLRARYVKDLISFSSYDLKCLASVHNIWNGDFGGPVSQTCKNFYFLLRILLSRRSRYRPADNLPMLSRSLLSSRLTRRSPLWIRHVPGWNHKRQL